MAKLTKESRDALPESDFAVPGKRALPMHDADHVRMGWDMVSKTKDLTPAERKEARSRLTERAKKLGVSTKDWGKLQASYVLNAMALNISNDDHPNKMPFSGIMTRIDEPSDAPPEGSGGKLITISAEAAEKGLQSLLGMAVDYKPNMDGHDPQSKIGIITAATIEGNAIHIEGFIYAADFPEVAAEIKASKDVLGFSYEARNLYTGDPDADPVVITDCTFTGAAILRKDKAAYRTTSISATADNEDDFDMKPEHEKMLADLTAGLATLTTNMATLSASVDTLKELPAVSAANLLPKVEPHATKLEACADAMEAAGIGGDPNNGHAVALRKMAGHMRAEAAQGRMPSAYHGSYYASAALVAPAKEVDVAKEVAALLAPMTDKLAALGTQITDLKAAAKADSPAPERKTLTPQVSMLLAKAGLTAPAEGEAALTVAALDKAMAGMSLDQRMTVKAGLKQAGLISG